MDELDGIHTDQVPGGLGTKDLRCGGIGEDNLSCAVNDNRVRRKRRKQRVSAYFVFRQIVEALRIAVQYDFDFRDPMGKKFGVDSGKLSQFDTPFLCGPSGLTGSQFIKRT